MTNLTDDWLPSTSYVWKIKIIVTTNLGIFKGDNLAMNDFNLTWGPSPNLNLNLIQSHCWDYTDWESDN